MAKFKKKEARDLKVGKSKIDETFEEIRSTLGADEKAKLWKREIVEGRKRGLRQVRGPSIDDKETSGNITKDDATRASVEERK